ncbi:MAG: Uma2 family endonuclease [Bacteroidota bacterium]
MSLQVKFPGKEVNLHLPEHTDRVSFEAFCAENPDLLIEREPDGTTTIMTPVNLRSGNFESNFIADLTIWARNEGGGEAYSSSTGFTLPDGSIRSPDAAWLSEERLSQIPDEELDHFTEIVPDFIIEVKSKSDSLSALKKKMQERWIANGVRLAWLVLPQVEEVHIYRGDGSHHTCHGFDQEINGEDVLPGFVFDLRVLKRR